MPPPQQQQQQQPACRRASVFTRDLTWTYVYNHDRAGSQRYSDDSAIRNAYCAGALPREGATRYALRRTSVRLLTRGLQLDNVKPCSHREKGNWICVRVLALKEKKNYT